MGSDPPRIEEAAEVSTDASAEAKIVVLDSDDDLYEADEKLPVIEHGLPQQQPPGRLASDEKFVMSGPPPRVNSDSSSSSQESGVSSISSSASNDASDGPVQSPQDDSAAGFSAGLVAARGGHSPQITVLDLLSDTASSSALPESFGLSMSRKGQLVAVYSSSNIWLVNTEPLPRAFMRILEVRRKPVALDVLDDGSVLAVLTDRTRVDIYSLRVAEESAIEKRRTIHLTNESHCLALSPRGEVVAAGHQLGVEVISLAAESTEADRRTISSEAMATLAFSDDGRTLMATSRSMSSKATTVFSVHSTMDIPFSEDGEPPEPLDVDKAWTSSILFPERAASVKHAVMLPDSATGQVNELFAFSATDDTWGIYDMATKKFTETKVFVPGADSRKAGLVEEALPALSPAGDHTAVVLKHKGETSVFLYRMPDGFEGGGWAYRDSGGHDSGQLPIEPCSQVQLHKDNESTSMEIVALRWLSTPGSAQADRLTAVGNLVVKGSPQDPMPSMPQGSTGVVVVMDFPRQSGAQGQPCPPSRMTFDLDSMLPGERLPESMLEFETEVELVRRRTQAQRRTPSRAGASFNRASQVIPPLPALAPSTRGSLSERRGHRLPSVMVDDETFQGEEAVAAFEAPYDNSQPRSQLSLNRAATVAAVSPANRRHLRALPTQPLEYRRADGLREIPHESDADNWVPPPPPYSRNPDPSAPSIQGPASAANRTSTNLNVPVTQVIPATAGPILTSPQSFGGRSPPSLRQSQTFPLAPPESASMSRLSVQHGPAQALSAPPLSASPHHDELFLPVAPVARAAPTPRAAPPAAAAPPPQSPPPVVPPSSVPAARSHPQQRRVSTQDFAQPAPSPPAPQPQPQPRQRPRLQQNTSAYNESAAVSTSAYNETATNVSILASTTRRPLPASSATTTAATTNNAPTGSRVRPPSFHIRTRTANAGTAISNTFRRRSLSVDSLTREQRRQSQYREQHQQSQQSQQNQQNQPRSSHQPDQRPAAPLQRRTTNDLRETRRAFLPRLTTVLDGSSSSVASTARPAPQLQSQSYRSYNAGNQPQHYPQQQHYQQQYQQPHLTRSASAPAEETNDRWGERAAAVAVVRDRGGVSGGGGPFGKGGMWRRRGGGSGGGSGGEGGGLGGKCVLM